MRVQRCDICTAHEGRFMNCLFIKFTVHMHVVEYNYTELIFTLNEYRLQLTQQFILNCSHAELSLNYSMIFFLTNEKVWMNKEITTCPFEDFLFLVFW